MITANSLTKRYGDRVVVDQVSFSLEPGSVTGFLGPNGAGKSTTMRMVTGLVPSTAGGATVVGRPYRDLPNPAAVMGTLLDSSAVHPGRRGRDHLRILAATVGVGGHRVEEVLELVGLPDAGRRRVGSYSLGMRQRLGIAAALLADPPVLMFDEPANGLDPEGIRWMRDLLRGHADRGGTVLLSSHLLSEIEHTVDRLLVIGRGRIVADAPIADLLGGGAVRVEATDEAALAFDLRREGYRVEPGTAGGLAVTGATAEQIGRVAARNGHVLTGLRPQELGLEELFFQLTETATDFASHNQPVRSAR